MASPGQPVSFLRAASSRHCLLPTQLAWTLCCVSFLTSTAPPVAMSDYEVGMVLALEVPRKLSFNFLF